MGVVYLTPRCLLPCWWPNVISGSCSAACSVPRRLVLRGNLSAVWDSVEGRRLRRLQPVMAWPAADRGGLFSAAEPTGAVQRRKTARVTFSVFWLAGGVFVRGERNEMISNHGGGLAAWSRSRGRGTSSCCLDGNS